MRTLGYRGGKEKNERGRMHNWRGGIMEGRKGKGKEGGIMKRSKGRGKERRMGEKVKGRRRRIWEG